MKRFPWNIESIPNQLKILYQISPMNLNLANKRSSQSHTLEHHKHHSFNTIHEKCFLVDLQLEKMHTPSPSNTTHLAKLIPSY